MQGGEEGKYAGGENSVRAPTSELFSIGARAFQVVYMVRQ
jgi:hypothetical protein